MNADKREMPGQRNMNCLSFWFPVLRDAGVAVPQTEIFALSPKDGWDMMRVLDGGTSASFALAVAFIERCAAKLELPMFLRTGQGSGKHEWDRCCNVTGEFSVDRHVAALVEWSHSVDMMGLPHNVWVCREMLPTNPLFRCTRYGNMPVVREWRFFIRAGLIECWHPYWPVIALEQGAPDDAGWRAQIAHLSAPPPNEAHALAARAARLFDGYWSLDLFEASDSYYVTDMALGEQSYHDMPCERMNAAT